MDFLNTLFNTASGIFSDTTRTIGGAWDSAVADLKRRAQEFAGVYKWLAQRESIAARDPAVKREYDAVMNRGTTVKKTVEKTTGGIDWLTGTIKQKLGIHENVTMGALPLIPVAVIAAAVAMMTAWLADAYKLQSKIQYMETHGISGANAAAILGGDNTQLLGGLAFVAALVYFITRGDK